MAVHDGKRLFKKQKQFYVGKTFGVEGFKLFFSGWRFYS